MYVYICKSIRISGNASRLDIGHLTRLHEWISVFFIYFAIIECFCNIVQYHLLRPCVFIYFHLDHLRMHTLYFPCLLVLVTIS